MRFYLKAKGIKTKLVTSGFYLFKSGIEIGRNFSPSLGLRFRPIFDLSFPLHFGLLSPLGRKFC